MAKTDLFVAVVGDIMDQMGLIHQFLPPQIQPLAPNMIVVGRAMTVLEADVYAGQQASSANPVLAKSFGLMLEALDSLRPNEVYLCSGGTPTYALWGELMSTRAMKLGAAGVVMNGYSRDTRGILDLGFPTFSWGRYAQDQAIRGKVIDYRVTLEIGGVRIEPGDVVFGDLDGVCIVPHKAEEEVFSRALEKAHGEKLVMQAIKAGMSASEAFAKYHIM
jgi:regulator of RNase E activity RraA